MLSMKGIDNCAYYRTVADNPRYYMDYTGTGNSLNMRHPHVLQLIMDSLRYWLLEMHVDGFRFDLAATLARELHDVDRLSRSEERRVGKECRYRWSPYHEKKRTKIGIQKKIRVGLPC